MTFVVAVVDDDQRVLESLESLLESAGHAVRLFSSAKALLENCAFSEIDCLVSDIGMPFMDGLALQRVAHIVRPELPVILITGRDVTDGAIAANHDSQGFFRKPFNGRELLAAVRGCLSKPADEHHPSIDPTAMPRTQTPPTLQIVDGDHTRGPADAPTTMLVYGDYECPHTRALELSLMRLRRSDGEAFRSVFRNFPLRDVHPHAQMAAEAAEAVYALAGIDAFWIMHDGLFAHQDQLEPPGLERRGAEASVDPIALRAALETRRFADRVERDVRSGLANGVNGTPSIFVNGERYLGERDVGSLRAAIAVKPAIGD